MNEIDGERRQKYRLRHPELDAAVEGLVEAARRESGASSERAAIAREMLVTGLQPPGGLLGPTGRNSTYRRC
jgi:hypothetical protein